MPSRRPYDASARGCGGRVFGFPAHYHNLRRQSALLAVFSMRFDRRYNKRALLFFGVPEIIPTVGKGGLGGAGKNVALLLASHSCAAFFSVRRPPAYFRREACAWRLRAFFSSTTRAAFFSNKIKTCLAFARGSSRLAHVRASKSTNQTRSAHLLYPRRAYHFS